MAGAVGIVFGLCVLSFTLGAALMYVVLRRREDAASSSEDSSQVPVERPDAWVPKPTVVEPVADDYGTRPIHRNPVMGLPQMEPALAVLAEPVAEPEPRVEPEPLVESEPQVEPVAEVPAYVEEPEPVADVAEPVAEAEPVVEAEPVTEPTPVAETAAEPEPIATPEIVGAAGYDWDGDLDPPLGDVEAPESTVAPSTDSSAAAKLPGPSGPQPMEHATFAEREDFRQRYLRTFEEARRKASSN